MVFNIQNLLLFQINLLLNRKMKCTTFIENLKNVKITRAFSVSIRIQYY